ncbi:MAG TPA: hypothetical protein PKK20_07710 [Verrucomicrobiota bacterium]|jgi:hypothetical protein|nr:hypothetical protein [Verrucomicrobiota bacterium]HOH40540.1 hypothetical protein [Verrucomicrobiota bacterium]
MKVVSQMGQTAYSVAGVVYKTPTAAANSISETPINGWQFWGIESTRPAGRKGRPWSVKVSKA